jgi:sugar O-acyltransferase (sialic acid O-acetyltransferase NeuD family)
LADQLKLDTVGFLDERPEWKGRLVDDVPVLGTLEDITHLRDSVQIVCASIGDPALKRRFVQLTRDGGFAIADSLVHPSIRLSPRNRIGIGSVICEGSILTINVQVQDFVIINTCVTLAHDVVVSDYATICPGVNVSGNVTIHEGAFVGTGSAIREKRTVGAWSVIGGGSFVKDDVPSYTLYAGTPAVLKKYLSN